LHSGGDIEAGGTKVSHPGKLAIDAERAIDLAGLDLKPLDAGEKLHGV
jgi:hypothetical protein